MQEQDLFRRIREIEEVGASGCLRLRRGTRTIRICFYNGLLNAAYSNLASHRLGQYLLREGFIGQRDLRILLGRCQRRNVALGELALESKLLDLRQLEHAVRCQVVDLLMLSVEDSYETEPFDRFAVSFRRLPVHLDLDRLISDIARAKAGTALEIDPRRRVLLKKGSNLWNFPWHPEEMALLQKLTRPRTARELATETGSAKEEVRRILNLLQKFNLVDICDTSEKETRALVKPERLPLELLIPEARHPACSAKLEVLKDEDSLVKEQFGLLQAEAGTIMEQQSLKVITISSPLDGEGKSLISCNLALCFSRQTGRRVILLDCNYRNPSLHDFFGISPEPGIMQYLKNGLEPYRYIRRIENLFVMSCGGPADRSIQHFFVEGVARLIDYLRAEFDIIFLDSPALNTPSHTRILTQISDGLLLVIRRGKARLRAVQSALTAIDRKKISGVILNGGDNAVSFAKF